MKITRIFSGCTILLGSALSSAFITTMTGYSHIGAIAVTSIIGFCGGCLFMNGVMKK